MTISNTCYKDKNLWVNSSSNIYIQTYGTNKSCFRFIQWIDCFVKDVVSCCYLLRRIRFLRFAPIALPVHYFTRKDPNPMHDFTHVYVPFISFSSWKEKILVIFILRREFCLDLYRGHLTTVCSNVSTLFQLHSLQFALSLIKYVTPSTFTFHPVLLDGLTRARVVP